MPTDQAAFCNNQLLNLLIDNNCQGFIDHCDLASLNLGDVLCNPGDTMHDLYFPLEGIISWEKQIIGSPNYLVVTLIGNEGMLSVGLISDVTTSPCRAMVRKAGFALRMPVSVFLQQLEQNPALDLILKQYAFVVYSQSLQMAGNRMSCILRKNY